MTTQSSFPNLGSLVVPFPPGWTFEYPEQCPVEGRGPMMEFASISFSEASLHATEEELRSHFDATLSFVKDMLLAVAAEKGALCREPTLLLEAGGRTIHSATSTMERSGTTGYFLQYVCVSLVSQHYICIGGDGSVADATSIWDDIMRRSTWANEA